MQRSLPITAREGICMMETGEQMKETTATAGEKRFRVQTVGEIVIMKWQIVVDEDKLHAILRVEPEANKRRGLKEVSVSGQIGSQTELLLEVQNTFDCESILQKLRSMHIVQGIDFAAIVEAAQTTRPDDFIIARGVKPREGTNGWVELAVNTDCNQKRELSGEGENADCLKGGDISSVRSGQTIAVIHPPVPGVPGITVTNELIPPKPVRPVTVHVGKGVKLVENGTKIIASTTGRLVFRQKGLDVHISVIDKFIHEGDVNVSSGHIRFHGDVDIIGSVEDGMEVEADGRIIIYQNVHRATVTSKHAVIIRNNVIGSTISAGTDRAMPSELIRLLLSEMEEDIENMVTLIKQLLRSPSWKTFAWTKNEQLLFFKLIKHLMRDKFSDLENKGKEYIEAVKKEDGQQISSVWRDVAERLQRCFFPSVPNESHSFQQLVKLLDDIKGITGSYAWKHNENNRVEMAYALNSTIYCNGDIVVFGQGCHNCTIHSDGFLDIKGVMRGGRAYAKKGASIQEAGSDSGISTYITVPRGQTVRLGVAKEGTVVHIGQTVYTFQTEQHHIEVALGENEKIVFKHF
ncbi:DUF342 domain-containing protein [Geobacillus subterraneus]|uniref:DUF342 domain-containing protein n=1 Tax=Geobacillus subterraneus TaxID=129338 RepID=UPI001FD004A0|nr:FapA family protein [Geobacillus subterraneus]